jgi:hypothetical protein
MSGYGDLYCGGGVVRLSDFGKLRGGRGNSVKRA